MKIAIYDATITEGAREAGVQLSVRDKLRIAIRLAGAGVAYVEGGWPGGRGGDHEIFREARRIELGGSRLAACACIGAAASRSGTAELRAALQTATPAVTLSVPLDGVAGHGPRASRTRRRPSAATVRRAAAHIARETSAVRAAGQGAIVELEGFFDAVRDDAAPWLPVVEAASRARAEAVLLSDTAGGALPHEVERAVLSARRAAGRTSVGIRARNDAGVAVANALVAVARGATLVATTVNGYGERCGGADLASVAAALELKMRHEALAPGELRHVSSLAHFVTELAGRELPRNRPYVGRDAFVRGRAGVAPHVDPEAVGNRAETAMADERGHPDALRVVRTLGLPARGEAEARRVLAQLAAWERRGFRYEGAEASFDLLMRAVAGKRRSHFRVVAYRVIDVHREAKGFTEATIEVAMGNERAHVAAMGVGPVNALDRALRRALAAHYPELEDMQLIQSRSRNLPTEVGTAGAVRVQVESADGRDSWATAGVSDNLLDACLQALVDAIEYKLLKDDVPVRRSHIRPS